MLRGVWQGTSKYVLSMCFTPAASQPCSNQSLRSVNPATGVQKIQAEEDSTLSWGNLRDHFVQLQKGLSGTAWSRTIKRSSRKLGNPNQPGMTHCKSSLPQCWSASHHNSSSPAQRHKEVLPLEGVRFRFTRCWTGASLQPFPLQQQQRASRLAQQSWSQNLLWVSKCKTHALAGGGRRQLVQGDNPTNACLLAAIRNLTRPHSPTSPKL